MAQILYSVQEIIDRVLEIIPTATFGEDNEGQFIIYTNLVEIEDDLFEHLEIVNDIRSDQE